MIRNFSQNAHRILTVFSQEEAARYGSVQVYPEHIFISILKFIGSESYRMLDILDIPKKTLFSILETSIQSLPKGNVIGDVPFSLRLRSLLNLAAFESGITRRTVIESGHLLIALARENDSVASNFFRDRGISIDKLRSVLVSLEPEPEMKGVINVKPGEDSPHNTRNVLEEYTRDLTQEAASGRLDPIVGRKNELTRIIQVLSRRTKNNPVLVGDPGVGKTAIVEGLAQLIANDDVPSVLSGKRILVLDLGGLLAGTKYRGEFEDRLKKVIKEVSTLKNIIVFIDEIHTIIGAGNAEGALDVSNMLKPALSRGEFQCIGATTLSEYRKVFEKDGALERRFQKIQVEEPDTLETLVILNGIKEKYEKFHNVVFSEEAISAAVQLSSRYMPDRFMPDKAIDLLDEAGAFVSIQNDSKSPRLSEVREEIKRLNEMKKEVVAVQDYEDAAEIRDKLKQLQEESRQLTEEWKNRENKTPGLVTQDVMLRIVSDTTGIPLEKNELENIRLAETEKILNQVVIGQEQAVKVIASAIRRSRAGFSSPDRPVGSFLFLGPTGVGKTLLAKELAQFLFHDFKKNLIRIDMSDYMEKHNVSRLVGAPPGYVGYDEGGLLTEKVRRQPYSVILLDEIEKAHPDVFNILLQILEEGELQDSLGHTVNFRNTVIIMTSNAGSRVITTHGKAGFTDRDEGLLPYDEIYTNAKSEAEKIFSPEFLNRVDELVVFEPLKPHSMYKIVENELQKLFQRVSTQNITLSITDKAMEQLVNDSYSDKFGARPLRKVLREQLEDPLAIGLITGEFSQGDKLEMDFIRGKFTIQPLEHKNGILQTVE